MLSYVQELVWTGLTELLWNKWTVSVAEIESGTNKHLLWTFRHQSEIVSRISLVWSATFALFSNFSVWPLHLLDVEAELIASVWCHTEGGCRWELGWKTAGIEDLQCFIKANRCSIKWNCVGFSVWRWSSDQVVRRSSGTPAGPSWPTGQLMLYYKTFSSALLWFTEEKHFRKNPPPSSPSPRSTSEKPH